MLPTIRTTLHFLLRRIHCILLQCFFLLQHLVRDGDGLCWLRSLPPGERGKHPFPLLLLLFRLCISVSSFHNPMHHAMSAQRRRLCVLLSAHLTFVLPAVVVDGNVIRQRLLLPLMPPAATTEMNVWPHPGTVHRMRGFAVVSLRLTMRCTISRCFLNSSTLLVEKLQPVTEHTHSEPSLCVFS